MYRTPGATIEEIVLERRSRPRIRASHAIAFTVVSSSVASMAILGARDRWVAVHASIIVFAVLALAALFVRTRRLVVKRVGRELRIREGKSDASVLVGEILEVHIDTRGPTTHAVVVVLRDGRRVPVGDARDYMFQAVADRKTIRDALLR